MVESQQFALLAVHIIAIGIFQRVAAIGARCHTLDDEVAPAVGATHTQHGQCTKSTVGQVGIQAHQSPFDGFQILGTDHVARHLHRINMVARREAIRVVAQRIALVIIGDGIAEVDGIRDIRLQRVYEFHVDKFARGFNFGCLQLGGRHDDILGSVFYLDKLIKLDSHSFSLHIRGAVGRRGTNHPRRRLVIPTAVGIAHAGTAHEH